MPLYLPSQWNESKEPSGETKKMVELTDAQLAKVDKAMDTMIELRTKLLGAEGEIDGGLCGTVEYLMREHNTLKRNFYILVAFMIGSGALGIGIWQLLV
jgi:hypothetical protein